MEAYVGETAEERMKRLALATQARAGGLQVKAPVDTGSGLDRMPGVDVGKVRVNPNIDQAGQAMPSMGEIRPGGGYIQLGVGGKDAMPVAPASPGSSNPLGDAKFVPGGSKIGNTIMLGRMALTREDYDRIGGAISGAISSGNPILERGVDGKFGAGVSRDYRRPLEAQTPRLDFGSGTSGVKDFLNTPGASAALQRQGFRGADVVETPAAEVSQPENYLSRNKRMMSELENEEKRKRTAFLGLRG